MKATLYELQDVSKEYPMGATHVTGLDSVSLQIMESEVVALVGPSGSGKSTLLNVLGLLETVTRGTLKFCGQEIGSLSEAERTSLRRHSVGFIFQNFNLIPILSALENVEYALCLNGLESMSALRKQALYALDAVGLTKVAHHRPAQLSGGQRQRVAIARALVKSPKVILADEPTANLDSKTAAEILSLMGDLKNRQGATVIIATHDIGIASSADRRVTLKDGKLDVSSQGLDDIRTRHFDGGKHARAAGHYHTK